MGFDSIWHWLILLVIVLVVFGTSKLRKMGPDLGHAVREFKKALQGDHKDGQEKGEESLQADQPEQTAQARSEESTGATEGAHAQQAQQHPEHDTAATK